MMDMFNTNFFSENSSFYFFSALLQANASIFTITGVYAIFKIQSIQNIIDIIRQGYIEKLQNINLILNFEKWLNDTDKYSDDLNRFLTTGTSDKKWSYWLEKDIEIKNLKKSIKPSIILLSIGMIFYTIGIVLASYIHSCGLFVELSLLISLSIFQISIIYYIVKSTLKYMR